jgi:hypothetical protein
MTTKQVYDQAVASNLRGYLQAHLTQADDGPYFVHVLEEIKTELAVIDANVAPSGVAEQRLASFQKMRGQIERRVAESADNPNHFEKARWFARYWNTSFPSGEKRVGLVNGPGLDMVQWRRG